MGIASLASARNAAASDAMDLLFWGRDVSGAPTLLEWKAGDVGSGRAWDGFDLQSALLNASLSNGVDVAFTADNAHAEVHLYARDPSEMKDKFESFASTLEFSTFPQFWSDQTAAGALPVSIVIEPNQYTSSGNAKSLDTNAFFAGATPLGNAALPSGGSVKAARVYNHGACSAQLPTTGAGVGLLDQVQTVLWETFAKKAIRPDDGAACYDDRFPLRMYSDAVNYLDHKAGIDDDLRGGFFVNFQYYVGNPSDDITTSWTGQYEYGLSDGILGLVGYKADGWTTGYDASSLQSQMATALTECPDLPGLDCKDLPHEFGKMARERQTVNILGQGLGFTQCDPADVDPCLIAADIKVPAALDDGESVMDALGEASFDATDKDALLKSLTERTNNGNGPLRDWSCVPDQPGDPSTTYGHHCAFTLPAKRLNVYPDAVELVWFDGKEVDNPAYAVYVMAHSKTGVDEKTGLPTLRRGKCRRALLVQARIRWHSPRV